MDNRKLHWWTWNRLCTKKKDGGLGFKDFIIFNQALIAKQAWRLLSDPFSLTGRPLKYKYHKGTDFLHAQTGKGSSAIWQSIIWGRDSLLLGLRWQVGDGQKIRIFQDPWFPRPNSFRPVTTPSPQSENMLSLIWS